MTITIYWKTRDLSIINTIRRILNITVGMTVNGENIINVTDDNKSILKYYEQLSYIQLRRK